MVVVPRLLLALVAPYMQAHLAIAQHDRTQNQSTAYTTHQASVTASICEARTINHITHSLPQLCLTKTWVRTSFSGNQTSMSSTATPTWDQDTASNNETTITATATQETGSPPSTASEDIFSDGEPTETTFMSFEDWKEMMLRRTGQDPQELKSRKSNGNRADERIPPDLGNFGLGDEGEISLDFDNYLPKPNQDNVPVSSNVDDDDVVEYRPEDPVTYEGDPDSLYRSKDAGKTCKERFSYSSFDAGATVLKTGPGTKNAKAILVEHKDSYMLLECSKQSKYVIVELSDDILIDTVVLANFEFFSSMIRHFRVSVSDRYPVKIDRWRDIGTFEARNSRDLQPFLVENPQIWAKYVRIEFLTHYGNEYYCPVSLLRIHGSRMLDSWKDSETGRDDEPNEEEDQGDMMKIEGEPLTPKETHIGSANKAPNVPADVPQDPVTEPSVGSHPVEFSLGDLCGVCPSFKHHSNTSICLSGEKVTRPEVIFSAHCAGAHLDEILKLASAKGQGFRRDQEEYTDWSHPVSPGSPTISSEKTSGNLSQTSDFLSSTSQRADSQDQVVAGETPTDAPVNATPSTRSSTPTMSNSKHRGGGASGPSPPPSTVQEGFFNAITKRLHNVETNLTLSLQYLEDQSRHLQDAFHKAEQKQLVKVTNFLENLNQTVFSELRGIRVQYDQIWQSTVIALESQREQSERDIVALSARLNLLADEVVFQKRMAIVQAVLLLCCLFLVIFSRGVPIPYIAPLLDHNTSSNPYPTSPTTALLKPYSLDHDGDLRDSKPRVADPLASALSVKTVFSRSISQHALASGSETGSGNTRSYDQNHLSPPATPGSRMLDPEGLDSITPGTDLQASASSSHRAMGFQQSSCRKPLPALPEHPSPQG